MDELEALLARVMVVMAELRLAHLHEHPAPPPAPLGPLPAPPAPPAPLGLAHGPLGPEPPPPAPPEPEPVRARRRYRRRHPGPPHLPPGPNPRSPYHGVGWNKVARKWVATIGATKKGDWQYIGYYISEEDAARAYDEVARDRGYLEHKLNFPEEDIIL